ncbi:MAG: alternative splicing regulator-domain-containing protein [Linnemannia elongata]|nr:MAG: alternative splicing regulator-domain-containing protein [Linnemannia elongata]
MWKTVAKEEKRIRELAESARRRAQRRKAFYDSRLGDPTQLLRVSGTATRLVANSESYTFHEDPSSLMPWAGDSNVLIDRFDGRALLDFLPTDPASVVDSGLRPDRDEDGIGNELRFERWHDLADKIRLHITEEQCLLDNEEEWNDLVARHHALIGKVSEKKRDSTAEGAASRPSFAFDYGTNTAQSDSAIGQAPEKELTALEEENIFDHLDDLTSRDRTTLDSLGKEFYIKDYYRVLRVAKEEEDERVNQLKVTAVNLERALAGKKPLKASEIVGLASSLAKNQGRSGQGSRRHRNRRKRSRSPSSRGGRRSSPSYEPYHDT